MDGSIIGRIFTVIGTLIIFAVILYLAYLTTKFLGKRYSGGNLGGKNIKILETTYIGQDKMLLIVKTGGKTVLLGSAKDHIEYLCDVDESQMVFENSDEVKNLDFAQILKKNAVEKFNSFKSKSGGNKFDKK